MRKTEPVFTLNIDDYVIWGEGVCMHRPGKFVGPAHELQ